MQLIDHILDPLPARRGQPIKYDYHYKRMGTCNLFISFAPQLAWRHVQISDRRTIPDFARQMKWLVDQAFPKALKIRIVLDNLNTHKIASLYQTFAPDEARRIARRLEFHFTPSHASWLNMAEIEWAVLTKQCLNQRIASQTQLLRQIAMWQAERNSNKDTVKWLFTCQKARQTMARLYPS
jgi:transposase